MNVSGKVVLFLLKPTPFLDKVDNCFSSYNPCRSFKEGIKVDNLLFWQISPKQQTHRNK